MSKLEEIILEHTRLASEYASFPINGGDTPEEATAIARRKTEIKNRIQELREEREKVLSEEGF